MTAVIASSIVPAFNRAGVMIDMPAYSHQSPVERVMEVLAVMTWNIGVNEAYAYYRDFVAGYYFGPAVSRHVESMAFDGTNWAELFNLMCGE